MEKIMLTLAKEMEIGNLGLQHITSQAAMHEVMERVAAMANIL